MSTSTSVRGISPPHPEEEEAIAAEAAAIARSLRDRPGAVTAVLETVQQRWHHLPVAAMRAVARELGIPLSRVYGVATFYAAFSLSPRGRHMVQVCLGTACYVRGGTKLAEALEEHLRTPMGQPSADFCFHLEGVRCLGCCSLAPVVRVDGRTFGRVRPQDIPRLLASVLARTGSLQGGDGT